MGKVLAILLGLVAMAAGVYLVVATWWAQFVILVKGVIPIILFFGGLIAFIAGISSLKDSAQSKSEDEEKEEEKEE